MLLALGMGEANFLLLLVGVMAVFTTLLVTEATVLAVAIVAVGATE